MKKTLFIAGCVLVIIFGLGNTRRTRARTFRARKTHKQRLIDLENQVSDLLIRVADLEQKFTAPGKAEGISGKFVRPLKVGQTAYLKDNFAKVEQVINAKNMLIDIITGYETIPGTAPRQWTAREAGHLTRAPTIYEPQRPVHEVVWLRGIDTKGLADGSKVELDKPLKITGTETYETIMGGSKTVFVLEPAKN